MAKQKTGKRHLKAVILTGHRDFGRCPLASRMPAALWPVGGKPAIVRLLTHLGGQGIKEAVICANGDASLLKTHLNVKTGMNLVFVDEPLPMGTAGCIRKAIKTDRNALYLVFRAATAMPPNVDVLIRAHRGGGAMLTIMFEAGGVEHGGAVNSSEIYICEGDVSSYIPPDGYCDVKEGLIPVMLRASKTAYTGVLPHDVGSFRDREGYLAAISGYLNNAELVNSDYPGIRRNSSKNIWVSPLARLSPDVRICEPAVVADGAMISAGAVIVGPTVIGRNVTVGSDSLIEESVLWDGANVGKNCQIKKCLFDYGAEVADHSVLQERALVRNGNGPKAAIATLKNWSPDIITAASHIKERAAAVLPLRSVAAAIIAFVFLWSYWPTIKNLWTIWTVSDEYSSGMLVPFLAGYVLWLRRKELSRCRIASSMWGLGGLVAAQALRYFGLFFMYASAERLSLVLSIASLTLFLAGREVFRKVFMVLLFLSLMLPLPQSVHSAVMLPLQHLATVSAVFLLEMLGYSVIREGNIINLSGSSIAVAEACNGLRMVTSFFVVISLVLLLVRRSWWEELIVFASSLPIALLCNSIRLTITAIAFTMISAANWEQAFHDLGGYGMMPLALGAVVFELWVLRVLTMVPEQINEQVITRGPKNDVVII